MISMAPTRMLVYPACRTEREANCPSSFSVKITTRMALQLLLAIVHNAFTFNQQIGRNADTFGMLPMKDAV